ncbi:hypothetical protein BASA82_000517 [Batrachochytrium salamandrivorans]|nr:hypothetical protein BASA82_000517 [Batrachochytrium salamandrivorans]
METCSVIYAAIKSQPNPGLGLKELSGLMRDDFQLVDWFRENGACEWVVEQMQAHSQSRMVAQFGCSSVLWMAFQNADTSDRLGKVGACEAVTEALKRFGDTDCSVARFGCNAIGNLTADVDENAARFGALGVCPVLVDLLQWHGTRDPYVAENVCYAVGNLVAVNELNRKLLSADSGICEGIVASLQVFGEFDPVVANFACNAIGNLALTCGARLGECGACPTVVDCLKRFYHIAHSHVSLSGCYAVGNLAFDNLANKDRLLACGACEQIVLCLDQPSPDPDVVNNAYYAVKRLAANHAGNQAELNSRGAWRALAFRMEAIKLGTAELDATGVLALCEALKLPGNKVVQLELHASVLGAAAAKEFCSVLRCAHNRLEQLELRNVQMSDASWSELFQSFAHEHNRVSKLSTGNAKADVDFVNLQFIEYFICLQLGLSALPSTVPAKYPKDGKFELAKCLRRLRAVSRAFVLSVMERFTVRHHTFRTVVHDFIKQKCGTIQGIARLETLSIAKLQVAKELMCMVQVVTGLEEEEEEGGLMARKVKTSQGATLTREARTLLDRVQQEENQHLIRISKDIEALFQCDIRFDDGLLQSLLTNLKLKISQVPNSSIIQIIQGLRQVKTFLEQNTFARTQTMTELGRVVEKFHSLEDGDEDGEDLLSKLLEMDSCQMDKAVDKGDPYWDLKLEIAGNFRALQAKCEALAQGQAKDLCALLEAKACLQHPPFEYFRVVCKEIDKMERELQVYVDVQMA